MAWKTPSWSPAASGTNELKATETETEEVKEKETEEVKAKSVEVVPLVGVSSFEELLKPASLSGSPKRYRVPQPILVESIPSRRAWGWLAFPAALGLLAGCMAAIQRLREQDMELAASQLQLAQTQQAYFALQMKPDQTSALAQRLEAQSSQLSGLQSKLKSAEIALRNSTDQASAREQELQKLVGFLKEEIKASEAQLADLKQLLKQRLEVKKAE